MVARARLNILDELYLHLNRDDEPWSVQLEVQAEGRIDAMRLPRAPRGAGGEHPGRAARAAAATPRAAGPRLSESRGTDIRYDWEIADQLEQVPLEAADAGDE